MEFESIYLCKRDMEILLRASSGEIICSNTACIDFLLQFGLLDRYALSKSGTEYVITPLGSRYLQFLEDNELSKSIQEKKDRIHFIIPVVISVVSVFISVCSTIIQIVIL